jgi:hypothetical protein
MMPDANDKSTDASFSPDGRMAAVAFTNELTDQSMIRVFDSEKSKLTCEAPVNSQAQLVFSKSGSSFLVIDRLGRFMRIRTADCSEIASGELGLWQTTAWHIPLNGLTISDDRQYLYSPFNPQSGERDDIYMYKIEDGP